MNCPKAHRLISPGLDDELLPEEREALARHLGACPACRAALARLSRQRPIFAELPRFVAPAGFKSRVMANLAEAPVPVPWRRRALVGFAEMAVLGGIIFTGIVSGGFLVERLNPEKAVAASLALDLFEPAPPDSLGGVYLAMTEVADER